MKARQINLESIDDDAAVFEDFSASVIDRVALLFLAGLIISILVIAAWSGILLAIGLEEGGGPLGIIARACHIHLLV